MGYRLILLLLGLAACSKHNNNYIGEYQSNPPGMIVRGIHHVLYNKYYEIGATLVLKSDSTFTLIECGQIKKGKWLLKTDSLSLYTFSFMRRMDSSLVNFEVPNEKCFYIQGNYLINEQEFGNDSLNNKKLILRLKKSQS